MNKYSPYKIFKQTEKLDSLVQGTITAPITVRLKPCNKCNHGCSFCVYKPEFAGMHETCNRTDIIPMGKIREILSDLKEMRVQSLILSGGGEPLSHPDAYEMLDAINLSMMDWAMITNGQNVLKYVDQIQYAKWIRVSANYWDADSFSRARGLDGRRLQEILDGISALSDTKCEVGVNYVVDKESYKGIVEATKLFKEAGAKNIRFSPVWVKCATEYHSSIYDNVDLNIMEAINAFNSDFFKVYNGYSIKTEDRRRFTSCPWQQIVPVIAADQNCFRCHNTAYTKHGLLGSLQNQRFKELWFSEETKNSILSFNPSINCNHQCSSENRIELIHKYLEASDDSFV